MNSGPISITAVGKDEPEPWFIRVQEFFARKRKPRRSRSMILVEQCQNWHEISVIAGHHCFNCALRDGYPQRGQPDHNCKNFLRRQDGNATATSEVGKRRIADPRS
jgi:hypothetical protein